MNAPIAAVFLLAWIGLRVAGPAELYFSLDHEVQHGEDHQPAEQTKQQTPPFDPGKTELTPGVPVAPGSEQAAHTQAEHRHEHGAAEAELEGPARFVAWIGKFHPITVHIPIALLVAAALAELLAACKSSSALGGASRYCLLVAAAGALVSAPLGWANAAYGDHPADLHGTLESHRWFGVATAAWLVFTVAVSELHVRTSAPRWRRTYRVMLALGVVLVSITGHLGATLIYGPGYYSW